jgi:hypothetical protein
MPWTATYADGSTASEAEYGSLRNAPEGAVRLAANGSEVDIPEGATPLWKRRVSINAATNAQYRREMIGYENDGDRVVVWVDESGALVAEDDDE